MSTYNPTPVRLTPFDTPDDGDDATAASVGIGLEACGDGVEFVTLTTEVLADLAALRAIDTTSLANNTVRHVKGQGLYYLDTGSSATELEPWIIDPTTGPGRWIASAAHETTRTVLVPCNRVVGITGDGTGDAAAVNPNTVNLVWSRPDTTDLVVDAGSFYPLIAETGATVHYGFLLPLDEFLIHGATLTTATLYYRPTSAHSGLPTRQPKLGIARVPLTGYAPTPVALLSTGSGYVQDTAANVGAYEADRTLVFTPDQNNVIDKLTYRYSAIIFDGAGTNAVAGNGFHAVALAMTAIPDARRG